jgi:hypothetical protein
MVDIDVHTFKTWIFFIGCGLIIGGVYLQTKELPITMMVAGLLCFLANGSAENVG